MCPILGLIEADLSHEGEGRASASFMVVGDCVAISIISADSGDGAATELVCPDAGGVDSAEEKSQNSS